MTEECPTSVNELFVAGTEPTERCTVHASGGWPFGGGESSEPAAGDPP